MSWRDFFYYSKGERIGLIILLCLITIAGILLIQNNRYSTNSEQESQATAITNKNDNLTDSSNQAETTVSNEERSVTASENIPSKRNTPTNSPSINNKNTPSASNSTEGKPNESVSERVNRLTSYSRPSYTRIEKFEEGTVVELNSADTATLKKVPGIGSTFAKRIVSYRNLLGGYYSVIQLSEVYGIDEERFIALRQWFTADPMQIAKISINSIPQDSLQRHPYISYAQARTIIRLRRQKGRLTGWENLQLLNEFTESDRIRLHHYLSFD